MLLYSLVLAGNLSGPDTCVTYPAREDVDVDAFADPARDLGSGPARRWRHR